MNKIDAGPKFCPCNKIEDLQRPRAIGRNSIGIDLLFEKFLQFWYKILRCTIYSKLLYIITEYWSVWDILPVI